MVFDERGRFVRTDVLPDPNNSQPELSCAVFRVAVASLVPGDLVAPEVGSGLGHHEVLGAPVPEATIDEDVKADPREYNVGASSAIERQRVIDPEPQARSVEERPDCEFRTGVTPPVRHHRSARGRRDGRLRCRWHQIALVGHAETDPGGTIFAWHASTIGGTIR